MRAEAQNEGFSLKSIIAVIHRGFSPAGWKFSAAALLAFAFAGGLSAARPGSIADHGIFRVFQDGQPVGSERFSVQQNGAATIVHSAIDYELSDRHVRQESELNLSSDTNLESYVWHEGKAIITVDYRDGWLMSHYQPETGAARDFQFIMPNTTAIVDSNFYVDWQLLAGRYDAALGGAQQFRVFVPHEGDPDQVTISSEGSATVPESNHPLLHLKAVTNAATLDLYMDGHKLVRLEGPSLLVQRAK
jgi:hypothetical protein